MPQSARSVSTEHSRATSRQRIGSAFSHAGSGGRIPFAVDEAEIRYLESADVRQGEVVMREIILLACHRPVMEKLLNTVEAAGLRPAAIDVEPCAVLRSYAMQYQREEDQKQRSMFVHLGADCTVVVIAEGTEVLFVKYLDIGGRHFDEAVSHYLDMTVAESHALRRSSGKRSTDVLDDEVAQSIAEATRPVLDSLLHELSMCVRYHSVTFRGRPLVRLVFGGEEASPHLLDSMAKRLDLECVLSDPFRRMNRGALGGNQGQWDVAVGLALRNVMCEV